MSVAAILKQKGRAVTTAKLNVSLLEVAHKMTARRSRHLPVVTDHELVGIISIGDVVKHHMAEVKTEAIAMREYIAQT